MNRPLRPFLLFVSHFSLFSMHGESHYSLFFKPRLSPALIFYAYFFPIHFIISFAAFLNDYYQWFLRKCSVTLFTNRKWTKISTGWYSDTVFDTGRPIPQKLSDESYGKWETPFPHYKSLGFIRWILLW